MKSLLFLAVLLTQLPLQVHAKDVIGVGEPGKVTYIYSDGGSIWVRKCEDYLVVKKLTDCKSNLEKNMGNPSQLREKFVKHFLKIRFLERPTDAELKKVIDEKTKMEAFKKAYGNPNLSVEKDPIIDTAKYKQLVFKFANNNKLLDDIAKTTAYALKEADQGLAKIMANAGNIAKVPNDYFQAWLIDNSQEDYASTLSPLMATTAFKFGLCDIKHDGKFFHAFKSGTEVGVTTIPHEYLDVLVPPQGQHVQNALKIFVAAGCVNSREVVNGESIEVSGASGVVKSHPALGSPSPVGSAKATQK